MHVKKEWIMTHKQQDVFQVSLYNDAGAVVHILNYGAIIKDILLPGINNILCSQVLSYDTIDQYFNDSNYIGCVIGRYANRISGGLLKIDSDTYFLSVNEIANHNHLHGGHDGFNEKVWKVVNTFSTASQAGVTLCYYSPHLEEGYPGNLITELTYLFSNANELTARYKAITDQTTIINLTNHTYFNFSAGKEGIASYFFSINADEYTPADERYIPDGRIVPVDNSIFDLRIPKRVDEFMHKIPTVNYCLNNKRKFIRAATVTDPYQRRRLEVWTTNPGLQLYCGNYLTGEFEPFSGICLEPQYYPDSPNQPGFPSALLRAGQVYEEITSYRFY